jgi:thiol-disulfide isomerase/thioredoxin
MISRVYRSIAVVAMLANVSLAFQIQAPRHAAPLSKSKLRSAFAMEAPTQQSFQDRMRNMVLGGDKSGGPAVVKKQTTTMIPNMYQASSLREYNDVLRQGLDKEELVVVRFHAAYCRACKKVAPLYDRLAKSHSNQRFVQVTMQDSTKTLLAGLGVHSVPYGHIYHPTAGLVEELSLNSKYFGSFEQILQSYESGECFLGAMNQDSGIYESPYVRKQ